MRTAATAALAVMKSSQTLRSAQSLIFGLMLKGECEASKVSCFSLSAHSFRNRKKKVSLKLRWLVWMDGFPSLSHFELSHLRWPLWRWLMIAENTCRTSTWSNLNFNDIIYWWNRDDIAPIRRNDKDNRINKILEIQLSVTSTKPPRRIFGVKSHQITLSRYHRAVIHDNIDFLFVVI